MQQLLPLMLLGGLFGGRGGGGSGMNLFGLMVAPDVAFPAMILNKRMTTKETLMCMMGMKQLALLNIIAKPPARRKFRRRRYYRRRY